MVNVQARRGNVSSALTGSDRCCNGTFLNEAAPERIYKNTMRLHGIALFMAVMAAFILTPRPVTANAIIDAGSKTTDTVNLLVWDIAADPAAALFATSDNATQFSFGSFDSIDDGFLSPELLSLEPGSFPAQLPGTQDILDAVPEPSSAAWLTSSLLTMAWLGRLKRQRFKL
jgi:hypothetical protein